MRGTVYLPPILHFQSWLMKPVRIRQPWLESHCANIPNTRIHTHQGVQFAFLLSGNIVRERSGLYVPSHRFSVFFVTVIRYLKDMVLILFKQ